MGVLIAVALFVVGDVRAVWATQRRRMVGWALRAPPAQHGRTNY
jgi:hypothetical protein